MDSLLSDLRVSLRSLAANPLFTAVAVVCLALGIGSTSAIYSIVDAVLLAPLPFDEPDRVVRVSGELTEQELTELPASPIEFRDWHELSESFEALGATGFRPVNLTGGEEPQRLLAVLVSEELFEVFGLEAEAGRLFRPEDHEGAAGSAAVLGHSLWQSRFGGEDLWAGGRTDEDRKILLEDAPREVIGVTPEDFRLGTLDVDIWLPMPSNPAVQPPRTARFLGVYGRLAPGLSLEAAEGQMATVAAAMERQNPETYGGAGWGIRLTPLHEVLVGDVSQILWVLAAAVGLVLLIGCVNVANLLLARGSSRSKEMAIRAALGASRWRVVRQLLTESVLLAFAGGALGLLLAWWLIGAVRAIDERALPRLEGASLDGGVFAFTLLVALVVGVLFGLLPALRLSRTDLRDTLSAGGKTSGGGAGGGRLRSALVIFEVALALMVLVGAGLVIKSFGGLLDQELGYRTDGVLTFQLTLSRQQYPENFQVTQFFDGLEERLGAVPGVEDLALVSTVPAGGFLLSGEVVPEGAVDLERETERSVGWRFVGPGYFQTLGIPLLSGRDFDRADDDSAPEVAIIDQSLAERLWPGESPLDRQLRIVSPRPEEEGWRRVVGVVGTIDQGVLESVEEGQLYLPHAQYPTRILSVVARTSGDPAALAAPLREAVQGFDRDQPVEEVQTLEERLGLVLARPRLTTLLFGLFAGVALLLSVVGVYGVLAYGVTQQRRELGVRMALGADRRQILRLILLRGLLLAGFGLVLGFLGALALNHTVASFLYGLSSTDPLTYLLVGGVLAGAALLASLVPALRATRVDPAIALTSE